MGFYFFAYFYFVLKLKLSITVEFTPLRATPAIPVHRAAMGLDIMRSWDTVSRHIKTLHPPLGFRGLVWDVFTLGDDLNRHILV